MFKKKRARDWTDIRNMRSYIDYFSGFTVLSDFQLLLHVVILMLKLYHIKIMAVIPSF